jgi:hypothetical protein
MHDATRLLDDQSGPLPHNPSDWPHRRVDRLQRHRVPAESPSITRRSRHAAERARQDSAPHRREPANSRGWSCRSPAELGRVRMLRLPMSGSKWSPHSSGPRRCEAWSFDRPWESCHLLTRRCRGSVITGSQYGGTWEVSPNDSARKLDQRRRVDGRALAVRNPAKPAATPEGTSRMTRHSPSGPHRNSREANSALFRSTHAAEAHTPPASVPPASSHLGNDPTRIRLQRDPVR